MTISYDLILLIVESMAPTQRFIVSNALGLKNVKERCILMIPQLSPDSASRRGLTDILDFWKKRASMPAYTCRGIDQASAAGYVHVLEWWRNSGRECKSSSRSMEWASHGGHLQVLEWFLTHLPAYFIEADHREALFLASCAGQIHILLWWERNVDSSKIRYNADAVFSAKRAGHNSVVKWWNKF